VILPDVNVLLYAFRGDAPEHGGFRGWLQSVVNGEAPYGMSPQVLGSVVRIATHPRIFAKPSRLEEALAFAAVLLDQPHCQVVEPGPRHWRIFRELCRRAQATGNLVQDAWFAALAMESGCEWITADRDYARFEGLRWRAPF
jgi:toxin-antitoxin system PIN domain toxin